jgi:acyl-CoA synthetase (AMP-forming)/AMP-acid ligase II
VVPGDRVLILLSNSLEFIAACFAVWKAGAILVAESPSIQDDDLCHIIRDCAPQALMADRKAAKRLDARRHGLLNTQVVFVKGGKSRLSGLDGVRVVSLEAELTNKTSPALLRFNSASPDDVATITYCGGAGECAGSVMNTHENWLAGAAFTGQCHGLTHQDALLLPVPLHSSLAMRQWLAYVMAEARIILAGSLAQAVKTMKNRRPSTLALSADGAKRLVTEFAAVAQKWDNSLRQVEVESTPLEYRELEPLCRLLPSAAIDLNCNLTEAQAALLRLGTDGLSNGNCQMPPTA